ncbi:hypothetical protein BDP81DRAFT_92493 [Colletotrichum phormii]|uniref:Uncharacterized protein n=1 Tax=Colletotrichum phormii TaxID=359342 RepID=A0AAJ0A2Y6_9PEZI|nr:uncharacterized protein BDP81DRAFT_92493 [Colletotrichum phormii]KAK1654998.1 hypothetical protein BDP81DRAFT_92493 [Colletotrichum phormii]
MDTAENTQHHFRSSVIRPQSNLPRPGAFSSGLSEMNESQSNTRAHPSMIPPPGASKIGSLNSAMNLKREVPKPAEHSATKHHKTLAERAGEYPTKHSSSAAAGAGASGIARAPSVKRVPGSTLAELKNPNNIRPRNGTTTSRYNQTSNFSASVGPRGHERAKSSLAHSKSVHGQPRTRNANPHTRPRTAYGHRSEEEFDGPIEQQHGWDVEGRVAELDSQFKQVKESMTVMLSDKELMDERVEMYKKRSE